MKFKKGDKVRLLNEKGEGVITRITDKLAYVEMEDGFEIPFSPGELVKVNEVLVAEKKAPQEDLYEEPEIAEGNPDIKISEGVYLVFVPEDKEDLLATSLQLYFINHTQYSILFSCTVKENENFRLLDALELHPEEKTFLTTISRNELEKYSTLKADVIFFKENAFKEILPSTTTIKLKAVKFYKENTYELNPWFSSPAHIVEVWSKEENKQQPLTHSFDKVLFEKERKHIPQLSKKHSGLLEEEVDLHIEELIDNLKGLSNAEIVQIQLKHFQSKLDLAIANNVKKIVFIHGVGNGRLKHEVRSLLSTYQGLSFRDASFQRYGFGATEVLIK